MSGLSFRGISSWLAEMRWWKDLAKESCLHHGGQEAESESNHTPKSPPLNTQDFRDVGGTPDLNHNREFPQKRVPAPAAEDAQLPLIDVKANTQIW